MPSYEAALKGREEVAAGTMAFHVISGWLGGKMVYVHGVAVDTPRTSLADRLRTLSTRGAAARPHS